MRTAGFRSRGAASGVLALALWAGASWNIGLDADGRYKMTDFRDHLVVLEEAGVSARKTFSDAKGDRIILFGLLEAENNLSDVLAHEAYARYKGPLGAWNVTAGRFQLPYGLLSAFSASRLLYYTVHGATLGMDADNGLMVSGTLGRFDYAASVTQGFGAHRVPGFPGPGLGLARAGFTLGEADEAALGVSAAFGATQPHEGGPEVDRTLAGADATWYAGRGVVRLEISGGRVDGQPFAAAFGGFDFAVLPKLDINLAAAFTRQSGHNTSAGFSGLSYKPSFLTIRGGISYEDAGNAKTEVLLQLYRLFSFVF